MKKWVQFAAVVVLWLAFAFAASVYFTWVDQVDDVGLWEGPMIFGVLLGLIGCAFGLLGVIVLFLWTLDSR